MDTPQYDCGGVSSEYCHHYMIYYMHHKNMYAPHHEQADVHSENSVTEKIKIVR
jgi:hypothetical protein